MVTGGTTYWHSAAKKWSGLLMVASLCIKHVKQQDLFRYASRRQFFFASQPLKNVAHLFVMPHRTDVGSP